MKNKPSIFFHSILIIQVSLLLALYMPAGGLTPKASAKEGELKQEKVTICVGEKYRLKANLFKGNRKNIKWKSSMPKTVSVSSKGVIFGKCKGNAKITGTCQKGQGTHAKTMRATYKVKVENYIKSMEVSPQDAITMSVGETVQIQAAIYPLKAKKNQVVYESENNGIATVSTGGIITAIQPGQVWVKITSEGKNADRKKLHATISVLVKDDSGSMGSGAGVQELPSGTSDIPGAEKPQQGDSGEETPPGSAGDNRGGDGIPDGAPVLSEESQACIDAMPQVGKDVLVARVVTARYSNGEVYTLYFINQEYEGMMTLTINEYTYSLSMSPSTALRRLETMGYSATNSSNTIRVERKRMPGNILEEWWKVTEIESGAVYELKGMRKDTEYANKYGYGIIVIKGDTKDVIKIQ